MLKQPVFVFTVPKSGTHLLANVLRAVLGADAVSPNLITEDFLLGNMAESAPLVYVGHVRHSLALAKSVAGAPLALLYRDPRDVVTSYCNALYHRKILPDALSSAINQDGLPFHDVLSFLILGGHCESGDCDDIKSFFTKYYLRWLHKAAVTVRYEDLLPENDNWGTPVETIRNLLYRLDLPFDDSALEDRIREGSDHARSSTFHEGRRGGWRKFFTSLQITQFKAIAGDLLVALGYEPDYCWGDSNRPRPAIAAGPLFAPVVAAPAPPELSAPTPPALAADIAGIHGRLEGMAGILSQLENRKDYIHNKISFLRLPYADTAFFCHTNDSLHRQLNQTFTDHSDYRNYTSEVRIHPDPVWIGARATTPGWQPMYDVLASRLAGANRVCYLDIGCFYGLEPILLSSLFWNSRDQFRIVAADPGPAAKLVPFNAEINGHADRIEFMPLAIDSHARTAIVYGEYGNLENVRTVNRYETSETFSYPCRAMTIDELVKEANITEEIVMKIDIQGGEAEALRGACRTLASQCSALMLKFIPHALVPSIDPSQILTLIPNIREVYHLPFYWLTNDESRSWKRIIPGEMAEFTRQIWNAKEDYCFLVLLLDRYFTEH